jgi:hypothetical protein
MSLVPRIQMNTEAHVKLWLINKNLGAETKEKQDSNGKQFVKLLAVFCLCNFVS